MRRTASIEPQAAKAQQEAIAQQETIAQQEAISQQEAIAQQEAMAVMQSDDSGELLSLASLAGQHTDRKLEC